MASIPPTFPTLSPEFVVVGGMYILEGLRGKVHLPVDMNPRILKPDSDNLSTSSSRLLALPAEVLVNVFYNLDIIDQSVLALTCKHMGSTLSTLIPEGKTFIKKSMVKSRKKLVTKGSATPDPTLKKTELARSINPFIKRELEKRNRPATRLRQLEYLLRFHRDGVCNAMPGFRLCLTCATFRPIKGIWGGDTSYLRKQKVSNQDVTKGPRCSKCSKIANDQLREVERAWKLAKKLSK